MKTFTRDYIHHLEGSDYEKPFWFECAMVSECAPLFDNCEDNPDVTAQLEKAKVIRSGADSECCATVVNFRTRKAGEAFTDRLNRYLALLAKQQGL